MDYICVGAGNDYFCIGRGARNEVEWAAVVASAKALAITLGVDTRAMH